MAGPTVDHAPANALSAWLARLETALVAVSADAMAAIMCIVVIDACKAPDSRREHGASR